MTTIVWDGETLAADGRLSESNHIVSDTCNKLFKLRGTYKGEKLLYGGFAGDWDSISRVINYLSDLKNNASTEDYAIDETSGIIVTDKQAYEIAFNKDDYEDRMAIRSMESDERGFSIGSGALMALVALDLGCGAVDAIKAARKRDMCSGGLIRYITFKDGNIKKGTNK